MNLYSSQLGAKLEVTFIPGKSKMSVASRATAQLSQELIGHHLPLLNPDFNDIFISMVGGECGISDKPSSFHCN